MDLKTAPRYWRELVRAFLEVQALHRGVVLGPLEFLMQTPFDRVRVRLMLPDLPPGRKRYHRKDCAILFTQMWGSEDRPIGSCDFAKVYGVFGFRHWKNNTSVRAYESYRVYEFLEQYFGPHESYPYMPDAVVNKVNSPTDGVYRVADELFDEYLDPTETLRQAIRMKLSDLSEQQTSILPALSIDIPASLMGEALGLPGGRVIYGVPISGPRLSLP